MKPRSLNIFTPKRCPGVQPLSLKKMIENQFVKTKPLLMLLAMAFGAALLGGCASSRPPQYRAPESVLTGIDKLYILPVVDVRGEKSGETPVNKIVHKRASEVLKRKKYRYEAVTDPAYVADISPACLQEAKPEWIAQVGPSEARWVMIFALENLMHDNKIVASVGQADLSLLIVDKQSKTVVWRDRKSYSTGYSLFQPLGLAANIAGTADDDAVANSVIYMLQMKFPKCRNRQ